MSLAQVQEIEQQNPNLWTSAINDVHLWPLIRFRVMDTATITSGNMEIPKAPQRSYYFQRARWRSYLRTASFLATPPRPQFSLLSLVLAVHRYPTEDGQHSFDRLYSSLYESVARPLIFQAAPSIHWPLPDRKYANNTFSQDVIWMQVAARGKFKPLGPVERSRIRKFVAEICELFDLNVAMADHLAKRVEEHVKLYPYLRQALQSNVALRAIHKVAVLALPSYFGRDGLLARILHEVGFRIVELQHGFVGPTHHAYQLPPQVLSNLSHPAHTYLPDDFLVFGQYWADVVNTPSRKFIVGYPYLDTIANQRSAVDDQSGPLLLISAAIVTSRTIALALHLSDAFPNRTIRFKLHPSEYHRQEELRGTLNRKNIELISHSNIHELMASSAAVISYYSTTVLFEALAMNHLRIFCASSSDLPPGIATAFKSGSDLVDMLKTPDLGKATVDSREYWADNPQSRMSEWVSSNGLSPQQV